MKFYFTEIYEVATGKDSFNSQRDEILLNDGWQATLFAKFQFPTGWNSTVSFKPLFSSSSLVSIPNGMKFYNSTRSRFGESTPFQFPTGWNSTETYRWFASAFSRFNSQRDEILLIAVISYVRFVSGFNSQRDEILLFCQIWRESKDNVSIPNGMKFYLRFI